MNCVCTRLESFNQVVRGANTTDNPGEVTVSSFTGITVQQLRLPSRHGLGWGGGRAQLSACLLGTGLQVNGPCSSGEGGIR